MTFNDLWAWPVGLAMAGLLWRALSAARHRVWLGVVVAAVLTLVAMPGHWRNALQGAVMQRLPAAWSGNGPDGVHYLMFTGLAFAVVCTRRSPLGATMVVEGVLIALLAEALQYWVPGRDVSGWDAALNVAGVITGLTVGFVIRSARGGFTRSG